MTPAQCRAARAFLEISQDELAKAASVGVSTVRDFEAGRRAPMLQNLKAIQAALKPSRGIRFVGTKTGHWASYMRSPNRAPRSRQNS